MPNETCGSCYQFKRNGTSYSYCPVANNFMHIDTPAADVHPLLTKPYVASLMNGICPEYRRRKEV